MMELIKIDRLQPHPQNPRKDLGDLTELAESIKASGILQNLTVIPWFSSLTGVGCDDPKQQEEMGYIVVIGHRRLAAAKIAGLTEVPCTIAEMDQKTQIATMLLENMQRSDLTILEQADGFQMMMDLGETVGNISDKTGFSETTIRRRVKLLELDKEKFKKSVERGATLMDFAELDKIQDLKIRNSVLDKIGTPNFKWELQQAIDKEKSAANSALIITELEKFAKKADNVYSGNFQWIKNINALQGTIVDIPDDVDTEEYVYTVSGSYFTIYKKRAQTSTSNSTADTERQKKLRERSAALDEISKRAYRFRYDFIREISNTTAKNNIGTIIEYSLRTLLYDYYTLDCEEYTEFLGIEVNKDDEDDDEWSFDDIAEHVTAHPERHLLVATYLALDSEREHYYNWNNQHDDNENLNNVYDFLEKLGYEMSDEERSLRDGTHKLFKELIE